MTSMGSGVVPQEPLPTSFSPQFKGRSSYGSTPLEDEVANVLIRWTYRWPMGRASSVRHGNGPGMACRGLGQHGMPCHLGHATLGLVPSLRPKHGTMGRNSCRAGPLSMARFAGHAGPKPDDLKAPQNASHPTLSIDLFIQISKCQFTSHNHNCS